MAFPFWWIGALTAALFLGAVFVAFGIAMRLVSRTTREIRGSMLPGLVSGFRDWVEPLDPGGGSPGKPTPAADEIIEQVRPERSPATERVRRH